jgi:hypothetical protein
MAIVGYGFTGVREVRIGDKLSQYTFVNDAHIDVVIPAGNRLGPADVSVVLPPTIGRAFAPGAYVYTSDPVAAPSGTAARPASGASTISTVSQSQAVVSVNGTQAKITFPSGSKRNTVQRKSGVKWSTVQSFNQARTSATLKLKSGQYRIVSILTAGTTVQRTFTVR